MSTANLTSPLAPHLDDPTQALGEDAELIVLVSEEEDGEEFLASIDDDDEYEKIGNLFWKS